MFNDDADAASTARLAERSTLRAGMKSMLHAIKITMRGLEIAPLATYPAHQIAICAVELASLALEYERLINAETLATRAAASLNETAFAIVDTENPA